MFVNAIYLNLDQIKSLLDTHVLKMEVYADMEMQTKVGVGLVIPAGECQDYLKSRLK